MYAKRSEELMNAITTNAAELGLKVNSKKNQMVCLNGNMNCDITSFIRAQDGEKINSGQTMKILGFYFGTRPTVQSHIDEMTKKFRKRLWLIRNLKNAKATQKDLLDSYCSFIRPILDYCSSVYHPMINKTSSDHLEKLQKTALKLIYGFDKSEEKLLEMSGITTLKERRNNQFNKFCLSLHNNRRFKEVWLEDREFTGPNVRKQKIIKEKQSRTNRLYTSPLYSIRRRLNDILVT